MIDAKQIRNLPGTPIPITVDVGFPAVNEKRISVINAAITTSSNISVDWGILSETTGESDPELCDVEFKAIPKTGSFDLIIRSANAKQKFGGNFNLKYSIN